MKRLAIFAILVSLMVLTSITQVGAVNTIPKLSQPPDWVNGFDVLSNTNTNTLVADDFMGTGRLITDIHWWGSYQGNQYIPPLAFTIGIWSDKALADPSQPLQLLKKYNVPYMFTNETLQGVQHRTQANGYYYSFDVASILETPFLEQNGSVYWLSVQAVNSPTWGWKTAETQWRDDAAQIQNWLPSQGEIWSDQFIKLIDPVNGKSVDMAFQLTTPVPEPVSSLLFIAGGALLGGGSFLKKKKD